MGMGSAAAVHVPAEVPANATDIIVVRHGETTWNRAHRLQGQMESDLNAVGRAQAQAVATRLANGDLPFSAIYASDLRRAYETALAIAGQCGFLEVTKVEGLRERHLGYLQGHSMEEGAQKQPDAYAAFMSKDPDAAIPGGGESVNVLNERITGAMEGIAKKHLGERIVVVCHGGVMTALHRHATGKNPSGHVVNASVNIMRITDGNTWSIERWGDIAHLKNIEYDRAAFGGGDDSA